MIILIYTHPFINISKFCAIQVIVTPVGKNDTAEQDTVCSLQLVEALPHDQFSKLVSLVL